MLFNKRPRAFVRNLFINGGARDVARPSMRLTPASADGPERVDQRNPSAAPVIIVVRVTATDFGFSRRQTARGEREEIDIERRRVT